MAERRLRADGARRALAWLAHPVTLAALVVLLLNDHLLKAAYPGPLTGKLSDVAGLVLAPPLVTTVVLSLARRMPAGPAATGSMVAVGAIFTIIKAIPAAANAASAAWSIILGPSLVRADRTDLFALPALAIAWHVWTRARQRPAPDSITRAVRLAIVLPLALFGVAATSAPYVDLEVAAGVGPGAGADTAILVEEEAGVTATTRDGVTWQAYESGTACDPATRPCRNYDATAMAQALQVHPIACTSDGSACYRVVPGHLRIEQSVDGGLTWTTAWQIGDDTRERYVAVFTDDARWDRGYRAHRDVRSDLSCTTVSIIAGSGSVVVGCGLLGFLQRDAAGNWTQLPWYTGAYHPQLEGTITADWTNALMIVLFGLSILLVAAEAHALRRREGRTSSTVTRVAMAVLTLLASALALVVTKPGTDLTYGGWEFTPVIATFAFSWLVIYATTRRGFPGQLVPLAVVPTMACLVVYDRMVAAVISFRTGWIAIGSVVAAALVANLVIGLLLPARSQSKPVASSSGVTRLP